MTRRLPSSTGRARARFARLVLVAAVMTAGGCSAVGAPLATDQPRDLPSEQEAASRYASLETLNATVTSVKRVDNRTTVTVTRKRERVSPFAYFQRVLSVNRTAGARSPPASEGGFVLLNGSQFVIYDPASNRLTRTTFDNGTDSGEPLYPRLVGVAQSGESIAQPTLTPGVSPLPTAPRGDSSGTNQSTAYRDGNVTVAYTGTETIDGRTTYRLELEPVSRNMSLVSQTVWLDTEYLYPIKDRTEFTAQGKRYEFVKTHRNVSFNPAFGPGTFTLEPGEVPEDARQVEFRTYESRAALAAAAKIPVPEPTVPAGFAFERATYRTADPKIASLRYEKRGSDTGFEVLVFDQSGTVTEGVPVQVAGYDARKYRTSQGTRIEWTTDQNFYVVSGQADNATLLRVARSAATSV